MTSGLRTQGCRTRIAAMRPPHSHSRSNAERLDRRVRSLRVLRQLACLSCRSAPGCDVCAELEAGCSWHLGSRRIAVGERRSVRVERERELTRGLRCVPVIYGRWQRIADGSQARGCARTACGGLRRSDSLIQSGRGGCGAGESG